MGMCLKVRSLRSTSVLSADKQVICSAYEGRQVFQRGVVMLCAMSDYFSAIEGSAQAY